jgi:hypothetical protein
MAPHPAEPTPATTPPTTDPSGLAEGPVTIEVPGLAPGPGGSADARIEMPAPGPGESADGRVEMPGLEPAAGESGEPVAMSRRERRAAARGADPAAKIAGHSGTRLPPPPVRRRDYAARKHG